MFNCLVTILSPKPRLFIQVATKDLFSSNIYQVAYAGHKIDLASAQIVSYGAKASPTFLSLFHVFVLQCAFMIDYRVWLLLINIELILQLQYERINKQFFQIIAGKKHHQRGHEPTCRRHYRNNQYCLLYTKLGSAFNLQN